MTKRIDRGIMTFLAVTGLSGAAACAAAALLGFGAFGYVCWPVCAFIAMISAASELLTRRVSLILKAACAACALIFLLLNLSGGGLVSGLISDVRRALASADVGALEPSAGFIVAFFAALSALLVSALMADDSSGTSFFAAAFALLTVLLCGGGAGDVIPAVGASVIAIAASAPELRRPHRALAPALLIALLAFLIAPGEGSVYGPLGRLSDDIKRIYEEYFNFTDERVAFTVAEKGYDYYGLFNGEPTHMLGGPADPDAAPVMLVEADAPLLLRGTVKGVYTGVSWTDEGARERNLYYDVFRRELRKGVFDAGYPKGEAFKKVEGSVRFVSDGTSAIFVPAPLAELDCGLENALYYNSAGELFLARGVEDGDSYSFTAYAAGDLSLLKEGAADENYEAAKKEYLQLPGGIDERVYSITEDVVSGCETDVEKAEAIKNYLRAGFSYRLDVGYPDPERDFVSQFLLQMKEGYCTYFASAFTVMCRIVGVPARYIEGYSAIPGGDGTAMLTGEDAHAWSEVFIKGVGFVPFDATPPADTGGGQEEIEDEPISGGAYDADGGDTGAEDETDTDSLPDGFPDDMTNDGMDDAFGDIGDAPEADGGERTSANYALWIIMILILLLAAAVAAIAIRLRMTDPLRVAARAENGAGRAFALFRAILTLYSVQGYEMRGGETPREFLVRLKSIGVDTSACEGFAEALAEVAYSPSADAEAAAETGKRAYKAARAAAKLPDRLRFDIRRVFHGIGDIKNVP